MKRSRTIQPLSHYEFSRIVLVVNPQSSNIQRLEPRARELAKLFPDIAVEIVESVADADAFSMKLQKALNYVGGQTLLGIGGGDGTVHLVANALLSATPRINLKKITILPLWGGNANDLAYMLNGLSSRFKIKQALTRAKLVKVYPLEIKTIDNKGGSFIRYAVCYASFGASAYTAEQLARPLNEKKMLGKYVRNRIVTEVSRAVRAMLDAPGFDVEQDGHRIKIFEQLFSNGSRMAKVDRLPVKLLEREFYYVTRSDKPPTVPYILRMLRATNVGEVKKGAVHFIARERAWAQYDGEAFIIGENTRVTVKHSIRPLYMMSTKLK